MLDRIVRFGRLLILTFATAAASPAAAQAASEVDKLVTEVTRRFQAGQYTEAVQLAQQVLDMREKALGPDHSDVAASLELLGGLYWAQGVYAEAEAVTKRAVAIHEKLLGSEHRDIGPSLVNLARVYRAQSRYKDAELLLSRAVTILEKALGPEARTVGIALSNLAELYLEQQRFAEAEPLMKRALAILEKELGPDHPDVGGSLNGLALLYRAQGRNREAEALLKRSIAIAERALGSEHPVVGASLLNLAQLYRVLGRPADAEPVLKRAIAIQEKTLGPDHPAVGASVNSLGVFYHAQSRYAEAGPLYERYLAISEKTLGADHPDVGLALNNLALLALGQSDLGGAARHWRRASALLQRSLERGGSFASEDASKSQLRRHNWYFEGLVKTTYRIARERSNGAQAAMEMFEIAQWAVGSEAATSLAQMAARSAGGFAQLAPIVRERQDLVAEWHAKHKQLITAWGEPPASRSLARETSLAERLAAIDKRIVAIDNQFGREFPDYAALATPKPISIAVAQAALRGDEALVFFLDTHGLLKPLPEETFVWVVTKSEVRWFRSELGRAALTREVVALRCGLDATSWNADGAARCAGLLRLDKALQGGEALPFDVVRAHALYRSLLSEARDQIDGKHLLIVPSGALTQLPFHVLVSEAPRSSNLADARWLIHDHAITVLPSVASLAALRRTGKASAAPRPLIGFGNPLLDGDQAHIQFGEHYRQQAAVAREQTGCATALRARTAALRGARRSVATVPQASRLADLKHLRMQSPLPETADELCEVARAVGGSVGDVWIGARATETAIKQLSSSGDLAKYRILHFATHGTLAGELSGTNEPGLILTPPSMATPADDGYLSGSEIALLKLDADWVILSACNTAGGAGEGESAEALSGLARVFFYAGARALLVSHWEVDSHAAVKLVTAAVDTLSKDPGSGRAEALRRAMLAVMADTTRPKGWVPAVHPAVWAPFVVVGEGGAGK